MFLTKAYEWGAVLLAMLVLSFTLVFLKTGKVWAQEIEVGIVVFCDTPEQTTRLVQEAKKDVGGALSRVNAEFHNPSACVIAPVAFVRGSEVGKEAEWVIVPITIEAVETPQGWVKVAPQTFFTAFKSSDKEA